MDQQSVSELGNVPQVIEKFYCNFNLLNATGSVKVKLKSDCKKCKKSITCDWNPQRVTSNLISHAKVRRLYCSFVNDK